MLFKLIGRSTVYQAVRRYDANGFPVVVGVTFLDGKHTITAHVEDVEIVPDTTLADER